MTKKTQEQWDDEGDFVPNRLAEAGRELAAAMALLGDKMDPETIGYIYERMKEAVAAIEEALAGKHF